MERRGLAAPAPAAACCSSLAGAEPVRPGGARGKNAGAPTPAQVRLQVNVIVGEQVFPGEAIHSVVLLARLQGQEPIQQRSVALDDQDATGDYLRQMDNPGAVIKDEKTPPGKRKVAEEELAQLEQADVPPPPPVPSTGLALWSTSRPFCFCILL